MSRYLTLFIIALVLPGCASCFKADQNLTRAEYESKIIKGYPEGLYFLEFDSKGDFVSPEEVNRAINDLRLYKRKKVVILSLGWGHNRDEVVKDYACLMKKYLCHFTRTVDNNCCPSNDQDYCPEISMKDQEFLEQYAIFCVTWDSSFLGVTQAFNDIIPAPTMAEALSYPPQLVFPLSYWSKASLADTIGYGSLKDAMELILKESYAETDMPDIYLIGHSFGSRILNSFLKTDFGIVGMSDKDIFQYLSLVKGALYIQPALANIDLPENTFFPLLVTQSRHDHLNNVLYPVANLLINSNNVSTIEGLMPFSNKRPSKKGVFQKTFTDTVKLPLAIAYGAVATPLTYLYGQVYEMATRHINYIPDTLAQIPVVQIPVRLIDRHLFDGKLKWGEFNKGVFDLGVMTESAARTYAPALNTWTQPERKQLEEFTTNLTDENVLNTSVVFVDTTKEIDKSFYFKHVSYEPTLSDSTVGWVDPVGSHTSFENGDIYNLIYKLVNGKIVIAKEVEDKTAIENTNAGKEYINTQRKQSIERQQNRNGLQ